ncbi:hypothetical protein [Streptomyces sp. NPDC000961]|uniref:hypothetical protein n=1 Tax=Streptomyces sp. NPDC000961 TaxID=3364541 RepID=UPI0036CBF350
MELSVLLHHRDFLRSAALDQRSLPRYFSLTERRFAFVIGPRPFQPEFQPVTEAVGERAALLIFAFLMFAFGFLGYRRGDSFGTHCQYGVRGRRNCGEFHGGLLRGFRGSLRDVFRRRNGVDEIRDRRQFVGGITAPRAVDQGPAVGLVGHVGHGAPPLLGT